MSSSDLRQNHLLVYLSVAFAVLSSPVSASGAYRQSGAQDEKPYMAASIRASLLHDTVTPFGTRQATSPASGMRSVPLAFGLSVLVPGLGQMYNRQWGKGIAAVALEAAVVTGYFVLRNRGLDAEDVFKDDAHLNWSPTRYARWLNDYTEFLVQDHGASISAPSITIPTGINFERPDTWTSTDRQSAAAFFEQIRTVERDVFHPETRAVFSHQLPGFGDQQYYELIGKYFQFAPGWTDYPGWESDSGEFTVAIDPEMTGEGGSKPNVSDKFYAYARDHAHSQDLLRQASRLSLLLIVNHLIAGIDAAISAKLHTDRISTQLGFSYTPTGETVPVASVRIRL